MGTTNEIKDIVQKHELAKRICYLCNKTFATKQVVAENWLLHYRTNHTTDWASFKEGEGRGWISIEIQLEHEECPE